MGPYCKVAFSLCLLIVGNLSPTFQVHAQQAITYDAATDTAALQAQINQQGATFEVTDYPDLSRRGLAQLAATEPPDDLALQAYQQLQITEAFAADNAEIATREALTFDDDRRSCDMRSETFDWREFGHVTDVKDQEDCGACWAFSVMAAYESSHSIINRETISGSEQYLLDCSSKGDCSGGWFSHPLTLLRDKGGLLTQHGPYTALKGSCTPAVATSYRAANWGYVERSAGTPSISAMKRALCEHGPVAAAVFATPLFQRYKSGIFNEFEEGDGTSSVNHGILIIGWDDETKSWIIKNSWGSRWGEDGFMRIRYNSNNVGFGAAWVDAAPTSVAPLLAQRAKAFAASMIERSPLLQQTTLPPVFYTEGESGIRSSPEMRLEPSIPLDTPRLQQEDFFAVQ